MITTGKLYGDHVHPLKRTINDSGIEMVCETHRSQLIGSGVSIGDVAEFCVLECGGTGRDALGWVRLGAREVRHIDLSDSNVRRLRAYCEETGVDNLTTSQDDILKVDLPEESFDIVRSRGVWHHLEHPAAGLVRYAAWCKTGGLIHVNAYRAGTYYYFGVKLMREIAGLVPVDVMEQALADLNTPPTRIGCLLDDFYVPHMHPTVQERLERDFALLELEPVWPSERNWKTVDHDIRYPDMPEKVHHLQYWLRKKAHVGVGPEIVQKLSYQCGEDERRLARDVDGVAESMAAFDALSAAARATEDLPLLARELAKAYLKHLFEISVLPLPASQRHRQLAQVFSDAAGYLKAAV